MRGADSSNHDRPHAFYPRDNRFGLLAFAKSLQLQSKSTDTTPLSSGSLSPFAFATRLRTLTVLAITYMTDQLQFSGSENGIAILIMLISSVPGGLLSGRFSARFNPIRSSMVAVSILTINTALVAIFLKGPDQATGAYILAIGWGLGTGWKWTCDRLLFARIVPGGQNVELSGGYVFFRQVLTWLPPLVFTIMNEADISLRWAILSLDVFFILGLLAYYRVGDYAEAVAGARAGLTQEHDFAEVPLGDYPAPTPEVPVPI